MNNVNERIFELIKRQFVEIMQKPDNYEYYKDYKIVLSNEQQYVKSEQRQANTIYIVVKFLPSSLIFGQYIQNITIDAVSEQFGIEVCKTLLNEYALTYNLETSDNGEIRQVYTTPMVSSNFNEIYYGFRSLFSMTGTFVVSEKSNDFNLFYEDEEKEVDCITLAWDMSITPNTQAYFDSKNFTRSIGQIGTFTINFTTYLTSTPMLNKVLAIALKDTEQEPNGVNATFNFTLRFKNGSSITKVPFKLINVTSNRQVGEIPVVSLTFTN